jgi:hypothetical protein
LGLEAMESCGANQPAIGVEEPRGDETDFQFFASWRRFAAWQVGKFAGCFFMENFPTEIE